MEVRVRRGKSFTQRHQTLDGDDCFGAGDCLFSLYARFSAESINFLGMDATRILVPNIFRPTDVEAKATRCAVYGGLHAIADRPRFGDFAN